MKIVRDGIGNEELEGMAAAMFGDMVKAVIDLDRGVMAVDAELHADLEALLLQDGSKQGRLWGINLYPEKRAGDFIEYDSLINIRPSAGNRSRGVEDVKARQGIADLVAKLVGR
ncbi:MAG: DUF5674 family protein [Candidatus Coatesbacteria bacterium]